MVNVEAESFAGDNIYFHPTSAKTIYFLDIAYLNLMDAGLFIYFPRDPGHYIYLKVFDGQDIYFKKLPAPPPPSNRLPYKQKTHPPRALP